MIVQRCALRTIDQNLPFRQVLSGDAELGKHLKASDLDACFSLEAQLHHVETIFARVFGLWRKPRALAVFHTRLTADSGVAAKTWG